MKPILRLVMRQDGPDRGLVLGHCFDTTTDLFKPNTVYQVTDILGELVFKEIGESCIRPTEEAVGHCNWGHDVGTIVSGFGGAHLMTPAEREAKRIMEQEAGQRNEP